MQFAQVEIVAAQWDPFFIFVCSLQSQNPSDIVSLASGVGGLFAQAWLVNATRTTNGNQNGSGAKILLPQRQISVFRAHTEQRGSVFGLHPLQSEISDSISC